MSVFLPYSILTLNTVGFFSDVHVLLVSLLGIPIVRSFSHFFGRPNFFWYTEYFFSRPNFFLVYQISFWCTQKLYCNNLNQALYWIVLTLVKSLSIFNPTFLKTRDCPNIDTYYIPKENAGVARRRIKNPCKTGFNFICYHLKYFFLKYISQTTKFAK